MIVSKRSPASPVRFEPIKEEDELGSKNTVKIYKVSRGKEKIMDALYNPTLQEDFL